MDTTTPFGDQQALRPLYQSDRLTTIHGPLSTSLTYTWPANDFPTQRIRAYDAHLNVLAWANGSLPEDAHHLQLKSLLIEEYYFFRNRREQNDAEWGARHYVQPLRATPEEREAVRQVVEEARYMHDLEMMMVRRPAEGMRITGIEVPPPPRGRGRPKKTEAMDVLPKELSEAVAGRANSPQTVCGTTPSRKVGPVGGGAGTGGSSNASPSASAAGPVKKGRGRPRKHPLPQAQPDAMQSTAIAGPSTVNTINPTALTVFAPQPTPTRRDYGQHRYDPHPLAATPEPMTPQSMTTQSMTPRLTTPQTTTTPQTQEAGPSAFQPSFTGPQPQQQQPQPSPPPSLSPIVRYNNTHRTPPCRTLQPPTPFTNTNIPPSYFLSPEYDFPPLFPEDRPHDPIPLPWSDNNNNNDLPEEYWAVQERRLEYRLWAAEHGLE